MPPAADRRDRSGSRACHRGSVPPCSRRRNRHFAGDARRRRTAAARFAARPLRRGRHAVCRLRLRVRPDGGAERSVLPLDRLGGPPESVALRRASALAGRTVRSGGTLPTAPGIRDPRAADPACVGRAAHPRGLAPSRCGESVESQLPLRRSSPGRGRSENGGVLRRASLGTSEDPAALFFVRSHDRCAVGRLRPAALLERRFATRRGRAAPSRRESGDGTRQTKRLPGRVTRRGMAGFVERTLQKKCRRAAPASRASEKRSYFCLVSVLVSVFSEVFFFPTFLVRFFLVVVFLPSTFDSIFVSVLCVCVPVTGFVDDLDSVDLVSVFLESFGCAVWAKTP